MAQGIISGVQPVVNGSKFSAKDSPYTDSVLANQILVSQFRTGANFTQDTFEYGSNVASVAAGKSLLLNSTYFLNVHLMGFGPGNPNPSAGSYNWASLDARLNGTMTGGQGIVLTGCCAPSWMKGGASDFGTGFETAPTSEYYDDYADLVAAAVARYPQIQYVQVWNEMKGFYNSGLNRWNYEGYTALYNQVWAKVKAVRPSVKIGGPYAPLRSNGGSHSYNSAVAGSWGSYDQRDLDVITYWLQNKAGADFLILDGSSRGRDGIEPADEFARLDKYPAFMTWLRGLNNTTYQGAQTLPVWWSEWYAFPDNSADTAAKKNALMATGLIRTLKSGVQTAMIWGPEGDSAGNYFPLGLFSNTNGAGGGIATPFHATQKYLNDYFSSGTSIKDTTSDNNSVELLASSTKLLIVNRTANIQTAKVLGATFNLGAYEVSLKDVPAVQATTQPPTSSTQPVDVTNNIATDNSALPNSSGQPQRTQSSSGDEAVAANPSTVKKLIEAFVDDTPVSVGGRSIPAKPLRYTSLVISVASFIGLAFLQRSRIKAVLSNIVARIKNIKPPRSMMPPPSTTHPNSHS